MNKFQSFKIQTKLFWRLMFIVVLGITLLSSPDRAQSQTSNPYITAACYQANSDTISNSSLVPNGGEMTISQGDPVTIRLSYNHESDGKIYYAVNFTATINTNPFTGSEHTFDTDVQWGGAGYSTGNIKDIPLNTSSATYTTGHMVINVTSDATGANILATCDFNLTVLPPNGDEDGDGLLNRWETNGIDANNDGVVDLKLSADPYNARWNHKDLFIEGDYMDCAAGGCPSSNPTGNHRPQANVIPNVIAAFAAAPVSNPDNSSGITLHVFLDEGIPYKRLLAFRTPTLATYDATFDDLKLGDSSVACDGYFGTQAERSAADCAVKLAARKQAFRYMIFGDLIAESVGAIGVAEKPGNDFFVQVGRDFRNGTNLANDEAAETNTFMHELGHTLGLGHGGGDDIGCKPNYLSVMNYMQKWEKLNASKFPLDFSRQALPALNESALVESTGISGPAGRYSRYGVNGEEKSAPANGSIDWNNDGAIRGTVAADISWISAFPAQCPNIGGQTLAGYDDWDNLIYDFRQTVDYGDYSRTTPRAQDEITRDDYAKLQDDDLDTIFNIYDNCVSVPNIDQADRDHDRVGDACDPDSDPPTINLVTPPEGAAYPLGSLQLAEYSCADEPGGSGLASCVGTVANGTAFDTGVVGPKSFTVTARDGEGHQTVVTHQYSITYGFDGFYAPVDNNFLNLATAGQAIPVKWRLIDSAGNPITNLAAASLTTVSLACSTAQPLDTIEEYAAGVSGLQNLGNGYYQINWKSPKNYAGTCKTLRLDLGEGMYHTANFQFK